MKNEKKTGLKKRVGAILKVLRKTYPDAHCELDHSLVQNSHDNQNMA